MEDNQNPYVASDIVPKAPVKSPKKFKVLFVLLGFLVVTPVFAAVLYSAKLRSENNNDFAAPFVVVKDRVAPPVTPENLQATPRAEVTPPFINGKDSVTSVPPDPTIEQVQARSTSACAITSCSLDVGAGLEDPIPPALKDILNAAGSDWNTPAKVILAFMYAEGYFAKNAAGDWLVYDWTEPNILAWSLPIEGTIIKKNFQTPCDDLNWGEQGAPSMFISDWDDPDRSACASPADSSLKCGIEKLVVGRGRYARRCNLLDSSYGLAKAAAEAAGLPTTCSWSSAQIAAALGGFTGGDPNGALGTPYYSSMQSVTTKCQ